MVTKNKTKKILPSNNKINNSKDDLSKYLNKIISGEVIVNTEKETITSKLMLIKDIIEPLKQPLIDKKINYSILSKVLEQKIALKVSAQTLRTFCQNHLDFPKNTRKKSLYTKVNSIENKNKDAFNAEETLSQNDIEFE